MKKRLSTTSLALLAAFAAQSAMAAGWSDQGTFSGVYCDSANQGDDGQCYVTGFTGLNASRNNLCGSAAGNLALPPPTSASFKPAYAAVLAAWYAQQKITVYTADCLGTATKVDSVLLGSGHL